MARAVNGCFVVQLQPVHHMTVSIWQPVSDHLQAQLLTAPDCRSFPNTLALAAATLYGCVNLRRPSLVVGGSAHPACCSNELYGRCWLAHASNVCLLFYILLTSKVISGLVPTYDSAHSW